MNKADNTSWSMESFMDAFILELDSLRNSLAVKALNKPLTYAVKDIGLDLQLFPSYDGEKVQFVTAKPGERGASKISIQLGSITDQQIKETTKDPIKKDDIAIDQIKDIDQDTKKELKKIGVESVKDFEKIENKNIDLNKVSSKPNVNYNKLANLIKKSKRSQLPPAIKKASLSVEKGTPILSLTGEHLAVESAFEPVAVFNNELVDIISYDDQEVKVKIDKAKIKKNNEVVITLDPHAVIKFNLK